MGFKENLRLFRQEKGYTQKELADMLNLSKNSVCEWEKGRCEPNLETLKSLSRIFNTDLNDLIGNEESSPNVRGGSPETFTEEERTLIRYYRAIGKEAKMAIFTTAESFFNALPAEKRASYGY